jgi:hypothetical protein
MFLCSNLRLLRCNLVGRVLTNAKSTLTCGPDLADFKCTLEKNVDSSSVLSRFRDVPDDARPLVLLFGWAGATQKNLSKYSTIYGAAGCLTLGYNLPSRYVFTETAKTPRLAEEILALVEAEGLLERPIFLHLMSDTGKKCCSLKATLFPIVLPTRRNHGVPGHRPCPQGSREEDQRSRSHSGFLSR